MSVLVSMSALFKDMYPRPGDRLKQWVVDQRREAKWERETCPRVSIAEHKDNTDAWCRNAGLTPWTFLSHDCCSTCCDLHEATESRADVQAWLAEKAKRPPVEQDRAKLSDEVEPEFGPPGSHALFRRQR